MGKPLQGTRARDAAAAAAAAMMTQIQAWHTRYGTRDDDGVVTCDTSQSQNLFIRQELCCSSS